MVVRWAKANYSTTIVFRIKQKIYKKPYQKACYIYIVNVNSTLFGSLETLDHSFKLKIMLNTTAALFMKVIVLVVKTMSVNPWQMLF